jgi:hypothetical protein
MRGRLNLADRQFDKIFTPAEANELIPRLEILIRQAQALADEFRREIEQLVKLDPATRRLDIPQMIERNPRLRLPAARMTEVAQKIESYGCVLKDIDQGLIDFPCEIDDDHVVFLCWQFGEPVVVAWHPVEGGFAQRQPLPGARKPYLH